MTHSNALKAFEANLKARNISAKNIETTFNRFNIAWQNLLAEANLDGRQFSLESIFHQKGKFPEGCCPTPDSDIGQMLNLLFKLLFGLDADPTRSRFGVMLESCVMRAGGYMPFNPEKQTVVMGLRADTFDLDRCGIIGGQHKPEDADPWDSMVRETSEETGITVSKEDAFSFCVMHERRLHDGRMKVMPVTAEYFLHIINDDDFTEMQKIFAGHTDVHEQEIKELVEVPLSDVLLQIREGKIRHMDQCQAWLLLALSCRHVKQYTSEPASKAWRKAAIDAQDLFDIITNIKDWDDWRKSIFIPQILG